MKYAGGLAGLGVLLAVSAGWALEVEVAAPGEALPANSHGNSLMVAAGDTLIVSFRLQGVFDADSSLGDGFPATLVLVVDLWRERSGWWDSLVRNQVFTYRFRRDIWSGEVDLRNLDRTTSTLPDRESLLGYLERVHEIVLGVPADFNREKSYYVTVKAMVRPMDMDDLQEVDAWLSGKVTGSGGGGLLGIPKALARIVVDVSGLGDQSAVGRSRSFVPRP
jgi:hypothetical protein